MNFEEFTTMNVSETKFHDYLLVGNQLKFVKKDSNEIESFEVRYKIYTDARKNVRVLKVMVHMNDEGSTSVDRMDGRWYEEELTSSYKLKELLSTAEMINNNVETLAKLFEHFVGRYLPMICNELKFVN